MATVLLLVLLSVLGVFLRAILRGAPYLPSQPAAINDQVRLSGARPGIRVAELGSGDGRVVIALARTGATVDGYERSWWLVWWSRRRVKAAGVGDRVRIHRQDFWNGDFRNYDAVVVFGMSHIMNRLARKLRAELKPGAVVVSNAFTLPDFQETGRHGSVIAYRR